MSTVYKHIRLDDQSEIDIFGPWSYAQTNFGKLAPHLKTIHNQSVDDNDRRAKKVSIGILEVMKVINDTSTSDPRVTETTPTIETFADHHVHTFLRRNANQDERNDLASVSADTAHARLMLTILNGLRDNNERIRHLENTVSTQAAPGAGVPLVENGQGLGAYNTELEALTEVTQSHLEAFLEGRL